LEYEPISIDNRRIGSSFRCAVTRLKNAIDVPHNRRPGHKIPNGRGSRDRNFEKHNVDTPFHTDKNLLCNDFVAQVRATAALLLLNMLSMKFGRSVHISSRKNKNPFLPSRGPVIVALARKCEL
jgi:hypothetical protein